MLLNLPWESIQFVTSGLTLLAFIVIAALYAWRTQIAKDRGAISKVPEQDMAGLLQALEDKYDLPTENLTPTEVAAYLGEQLAMKERIARQRLILIGFLALLFTGLAAFSIWKAGGRTPPNVAVVTLPAGLTWEKAVKMFCSDAGLTPQLGKACTDLRTKVIEEGEITYDGRIENLIKLLTLRIQDPTVERTIEVNVQKPEGIIQINCQ